MPSLRPLKILILEDRLDDCELLVDELRQAGFSPEWRCIETEAEYLDYLDAGPDLILADYTLPQFDAPRALYWLKKRGLDIPFIVVTGTVREEAAVECMKNGAADYLLKDRLTRLGQAVEQALQAKRLRDEKRAADMMLRKSEAFNRAVLSSLIAHIAVIDREGTIVAVNDAWSRFALENGADSSTDTGIGSNYLKVCQDSALGGDEDAAQALIGIHSVLTGTQAQYIMEYACHSPGQQRWFVMRVSPLADGSGGAVISHSDSTDRKLAAVSLERELRLLRTLIDNMPGYVYVRDTASRFVDANLEAVARIGAPSLKALIGKTDFDFYPEEAAAEYYADDQYVIHTGEPLINHEERAIDYRSGALRWLLTTKVPLRDDQGKIIGLVGISHDITDRKQSELALRQSEARFSKAFRASPAGKFIAQMSNGLIIDVNTSFVKLIGYTPEELIGHSIIDLNLWKNEQAAAQLIALLHEQGSIRDKEENLRTKAGTFRHVLASAELIDLDGEPCILTSMFDVTDRDRLQEERMNAELLRAELSKERELLTLKEQFLSKLSHDFRTPLAVIQASSDLLSQYFDRLTPEKRLRYAQEIQAQIKVMTDMTDEVLVINRAQSGKLSVHPSPLNLVGFCRTLFEDMQLIDRADHEFMFTCDGRFDDVALDEKLLRHILVNLLTNAIKYSPNGGTIHFNVTAENSHVVFRISDQGIGIPEEDQRRLFEEFYRAKNTGTIAGTGLGLSIVKRSVEAHGGTMEVESKVGVGTTFTVHLPANFKSAQA